MNTEFSCAVANRKERDFAFRLLYKAYHQKGFIEASPTVCYSTPWHAQSETDVLIVRQQRRIVLTATFIPDTGCLPADAVYPEAVSQLRRDHKLAELTSFAARCPMGLDVYYAVICLGKFIIQLALGSNFDALLQLVHPRHVRLYRRFGFLQVIGSGQTYAAVNNQPASAILHDLRRRDYPLAEQLHNPNYEVDLA